jgi:hypothetical protein
VIYDKAYITCAHGMMYIVQPSLSKANPSEDILQLLGVPENSLKETSVFSCVLFQANKDIKSTLPNHL